MIQKIFQVTFFASFILIFGFGCNSNSADNATQVKGTHENAQFESTTSTSKRDGWMVYTNTSYGISVEIPRSWKIAEYTGSNGIDGLEAISFDPDTVGTQVEYDTMDKAMGLVTINVDTKIISSEFFRVNKVTMGKHKIPADLIIQLCKAPECPNPWWVNRARVDYYVDLPLDKKTEKFDSLRISFQYPEGTEAEDSFRVTLEDIVRSFAFVDKNR